MKYSILICTLLFAGVAYGQVEVQVEAEAQMPSEQRAPRMQQTNESRSRVQSLTDIEVDGEALLKSRFNIAQQQRLNNAGEIQQVKAEKMEKVRTLIESRKDRWQENKVRLSEMRERKVEEKTAAIITRLNAAVDRLVRIDVKIQGFVTEETPDDIVEAFNEAHSLLEEARVSVTAISTELETQIQSNEGLSLEAIKELATQGKDDIKAAWSAYIAVNTQLRGEFESNNDNN